MQRPALALLAMLLLASFPLAHAGDQDLAGVRIAVDAGHGGSDPGASGFGLLEKDVNLDVALRVRALLEAEGATVLLTRDCDCTVSLTARTDAANAWGAHRFISIHANACGGCGGHGTETYYHTSLSGTSTAAQLARVVQEEAVQHLATTDRGVKQANFHVLRETTMPAVLLEMAFLDHAGDNAKLANPAMRQEAARAVLHAVQRHYGIAPHDPVQDPPFEVRILQPAAGTWQRDTIQAQGATNQEGSLQWMRFLVDGAITKWVTPAPHAWDWDTTGWPDGAHVLRLEGQNQAGERAADERTVQLDNTPPDASITNPRAGSAHLDGARVSTLIGLTLAAGRVPVEVEASDPSPGSGMARVDFLVDGALRASDAAPPYAWTWPAEDEALGSHTLRIVAWDNVGNARSVERTVHLTAPTTLEGLFATL